MWRMYDLFWVEQPQAQIRRQSTAHVHHPGAALQLLHGWQPWLEMPPLPNLIHKNSVDHTKEINMVA